MSYSLHVNDNEDGTGAIVYVTADVTPYYVERQTVAVGSYGAWVQVAGPLSGSGHVTISGVGYWRWKVTDGAGTDFAGPLFQATTDDGDSVWERCLIMIADRVAVLDLKGINSVVAVMPEGATGDVGSSKGVIVCSSPKISTIERPFIAVYNTGLVPEDQNGPILTDYIDWPVAIELIGEDQKNDLERLRARWNMYHERISCAVRNQRWDYRVPELLFVNVRMGTAVMEDFLKTIKTRVGSMTALCRAEMYRGIKPPNEQ